MNDSNFLRKYKGLMRNDIQHDYATAYSYWMIGLLNFTSFTLSSEGSHQYWDNLLIHNIGYPNIESMSQFD